MTDPADRPPTHDGETPGRAVEPAPASSSRPRMPVYRDDELDAERGPGLGCFWFQVILLGIFFFLTPLTVKLSWPPIVSAILLFVTIGLLLFVGNTVIFLLRIVAAERRGRRRPLASQTRTVGEIEEAAAAPEGSAAEPVPPGLGAPSVPSAAPEPPTADAGPSPVERPDGHEGVRQ